MWIHNTTTQIQKLDLKFASKISDKSKIYWNWIMQMDFFSLSIISTQNHICMGGVLRFITADIDKPLDINFLRLYGKLTCYLCYKFLTTSHKKNYWIQGLQNSGILAKFLPAHSFTNQFWFLMLTLYRHNFCMTSKIIEGHIHFLKYCFVKI